MFLWRHISMKKDKKPWTSTFKTRTKLALFSCCQKQNPWSVLSVASSQNFCCTAFKFSTVSNWQNFNFKQKIWLWTRVLDTKISQKIHPRMWKNHSGIPSEHGCDNHFLHITKQKHIAFAKKMPIGLLVSHALSHWCKSSKGSKQWKIHPKKNTCSTDSDGCCLNQLFPLWCFWLILVFPLSTRLSASLLQTTGTSMMKLQHDWLTCQHSQVMIFWDERRRVDWLMWTFWREWQQWWFTCWWSKWSFHDKKRKMSKFLISPMWTVQNATLFFMIKKQNNQIWNKHLFFCCVCLPQSLVGFTHWCFHWQEWAMSADAASVFDFFICKTMSQSTSAHLASSSSKLSVSSSSSSSCGSRLFLVFIVVEKQHDASGFSIYQGLNVQNVSAMMSLWTASNLDQVEWRKLKDWGGITDTTHCCWPWIKKSMWSKTSNSWLLLMCKMVVWHKNMLMHNLVPHSKRIPCWEQKEFAQWWNLALPEVPVPNEWEAVLCGWFELVKSQKRKTQVCWGHCRFASVPSSVNNWITQKCAGRDKRQCAVCVFQTSLSFCLFLFPFFNKHRQQAINLRHQLNMTTAFPRSICPLKTLKHLCCRLFFDKPCDVCAELVSDANFWTEGEFAFFFLPTACSFGANQAQICIIITRKIKWKQIIWSWLTCDSHLMIVCVPLRMLRCWFPVFLVAAKQLLWQL